MLWGCFGGWVFSQLGIPLAWMIGAMIFTAGAAITGVRLQGPGKGRAVMITVLGVMLGSAFTPDIANHLSSWLLSIAVLLVFVVLVSVFWRGDFSASPVCRGAKRSCQQRPVVSARWS